MKRWVVCILIALLTTVGLCAESKEYRKGKLLDVQTSGRTLGVPSQGGTLMVPYNSHEVSVQVDDTIYIGEYNHRTIPKDFVVGDDVDVRLTDSHMFLKGKDGGEWKLRIVQRRRANQQP
jgi:hypothetical protein